MIRLHLFEFEDQVWFPKRIRNLITDILGHLVKNDLYLPSTNKIKEVMQQADCDQIIDLCAGSGEAALRLQAALQENNFPTKLILTDKYPNAEKIKALNNASVCYFPQSIDAVSVSPNLKGFRTLFASFHHFNPSQAQKILQDAVTNGMPIGIFEFTERRWNRIFFMLLAVFYALMITPFIKPFSLRRLFYTYIFPIVPLVFAFDGIISTLRTYNEDELKKMISLLENNNFAWEIGKYSTKIWTINVTYLLGWPKL